jgi:hypothetical protein
MAPSARSSVIGRRDDVDTILGLLADTRLVPGTHETSDEMARTQWSQLTSGTDSSSSFTGFLLGW